MFFCLKANYCIIIRWTIVSYRKVSSSDGTPAVDINIKKSKESGGVKQQKIHFVKEYKWLKYKSIDSSILK